MNQHDLMKFNEMEDFVTDEYECGSVTGYEPDLLEENPTETVNNISVDIWGEMMNQNDYSADSIDITDTDISKKTQETAQTEKSLDELIDELPENFPDANSILKSNILPAIIEMDAGLQDYYTDVLKKKFSVGKQSIKEALKACKLEQEIITAGVDCDGYDALDDKDEIDPEIIERAEELALDPFLLKSQIDIVNSLGIQNERLNIGMYCLTIHSRLNPIGVKGSNTLALKNTGKKGSGKSVPLLAVLKIFPESTYEYLNGGSAKSLYFLENGISYKTIIIGEAFSFQKNNSNDTEFSYILRCLLSEGFGNYQYTGTIDGKKVTIKNSVKGPISLITTSIYDDLEEQLDDRCYNIHPNISFQQTDGILEKEAEQASGVVNSVDEKEIQAWQYFNGSLQSFEVVIPLAIDIYKFLVKEGNLPISARRAFKRVLIAIKTICILHQKQRQQDDQGRLIAEISDYALTYQLIDGAFRESLGDGKYTDRRIQLIDRAGPITPRDLAKQEGVSGAAITGWSKNWLEKGVLIWCDDQGEVIKGADKLKKMKHSGKAFLKVVGVNRLPTVFELTGDDRWDVGGELYQMYDLELDSGNDLLSADSDDDVDLITSDDNEMVDIIEDEDGVDGGVKVLNHKTHEEVMEMTREKKEKLADFDINPDDSEVMELYEEFSEILKPYVPRDANVARL